MLCVGADGTYQPLTLTADGELVTNAAGGGGGPTQYADGATRSAGSTGTMTVAVRNDTLEPLVDSDNTFAPLQVNAAGALYTAVSNSQTLTGVRGAHGDVSVHRFRRMVSGQAIHNFVPANFRVYSFGSGSGSAEGGYLVVKSSTDAFGYGAIQSFRSVSVKTGESVMVRACAMFPHGGVAGYISGVGMIQIGGELSFGYNGVNFGVWRRHSGRAHAIVLTITTAAVGSQTVNVKLNAGGAAGAVDENVFLEGGETVPTGGDARYADAAQIANHFRDNVAAWTVEQVNNKIVFIAESDGVKSGAYAYTHVSGGSTESAGAFDVDDDAVVGINTTDVHIPQGSWSGSAPDGFDPTQGNMYCITFPASAFGIARFYIADPARNCSWRLAHELSNLGTASPLVPNPSGRVGFYVTNDPLVGGGGTDVHVRCYEITGYASNPTETTRNPRASENTEPTETTEINILGVQCRRSVNNQYNQAEVLPQNLSLSNDSAVKTAIFRVRTGANFTNTYADEPYSFFSYAGSPNLITLECKQPTPYASGGRLIGTYVVGPQSSVIVCLSALGVRVPPSLTISVTGEMVSGSAALSVGLTWTEDIQ